MLNQQMPVEELIKVLRDCAMTAKRRTADQHAYTAASRYASDQNQYRHAGDGDPLILSRKKSGNISPPLIKLVALFSDRISGRRQFGAFLDLVKQSRVEHIVDLKILLSTSNGEFFPYSLNQADFDRIAGPDSVTEMLRGLARLPKASGVWLILDTPLNNDGRSLGWMNALPVDLVLHAYEPTPFAEFFRAKKIKIGRVNF